MQTAIYGTLRIMTAINVGDRTKGVTLHTVNGIERESCEDRVGEFLRDNPQYGKHPLFAEWTCREVIHVPPIQRRERGVDVVSGL